MLGKRRGESRQTLLSNKMLKWQRKFHLSSCPAPNRSPLIDDFEIIRCELCLYAIRIGRVAHRNKREMSYGQIPVSQNDLGNDGFIFKQWRFHSVLSLCFFPHRRCLEAPLLFLCYNNNHRFEARITLHL